MVMDNCSMDHCDKKAMETFGEYGKSVEMMKKYR